MNKFSYQSIEEVDPVDLATLLGSAGGMWGESQNAPVVSELQCIVQSLYPVQFRSVLRTFQMRNPLGTQHLSLLS